METLLRRRLWLLDSAAIALMAICAAHAAATAIAVVFPQRPAPPSAWPVARAWQVDTAPAKPIAKILSRNIFCSSCPPALSTTPARPGDPEPRHPRPTALGLRLVAVMYAPPPTDPGWSLAIIRDDDARTTTPRILGSRVREATIDQIDQTRVYLDFGGGRREYLDLLQQPLASAAAPRPSPPPEAAGALGTSLRDGIRRTGEHQYEVRRSTLDTWLDLRRLATEVRALPEIRDGKGAGVRLLAIRPDGPLAAIGLRNGDVIVAVNGLEMNSPDQAIEAYLKLRSAGHISISLERGGQRINLEYSIR